MNKLIIIVALYIAVLITPVLAVDFNISTTEEFDAGNKSDTYTNTDNSYVASGELWLKNGYVNESFGTDPSWSQVGTNIAYRGATGFGGIYDKNNNYEAYYTPIISRTQDDYLYAQFIYNHTALNGDYPICWLGFFNDAVGDTGTNAKNMVAVFLTHLGLGTVQLAPIIYDDAGSSDLGTGYQSTVGTDWYVTLEYVSETLTLNIYSDTWGGTLLSSQSVTLTGGRTFAVNVTGGREYGGAGAHTATIYTDEWVTKTYYSSGNWTSSAQTMIANNFLGDTNIFFQDIDANYYIDEIVWLNGSDVMELDDTYLRDDGSLGSYWKFEDTTDEIGVSDLTGVNSPTFTAGKFNNAVNLDGSSQYLYTADNANINFGTDNFAISAWIKGDNFESGGQHNTVLSKINPEVSGQWAIQVNRATTPGILIFRTGATQPLTSTRQIATGSWYHIAVVREGTGANQAKLYINGELEVTGTINQNLNSNENLQIGYRNSGYNAYFDGQIDDVAIFNHLLSANDVLDIYEGAYARYSTNITAGTNLTINSSDPQKGSLADVNDDFKIKIYLIGNETHTPIINEIYGWDSQVSCYYIINNTIGAVMFNSSPANLCYQWWGVEYNYTIHEAEQYGHLAIGYLPLIIVLVVLLLFYGAIKSGNPMAVLGIILIAFFLFMALDVTTSYRTGIDAWRDNITPTAIETWYSLTFNDVINATERIYNGTGDIAGH